MFDEKCRKCGGKLVHIIHLKSRANYRMCSSLFNSLQTQYVMEGSRIYCGSPNQQSKIPLAKIKTDHCVFCNQKMEKFMQVAGMKPLDICPSAFGMFLYAFQNEIKGITTKIYCEPKIEAQAKITKPEECTIKKGVTNHPFALVKISTPQSDTLSNISMQIDAPSGWTYIVNPTRIDNLPPNSTCEFDIRLNIPEATKSGEYLLRYKPLVERLNGKRLAEIGKEIKFDKPPTIVKITVP